MPPLQRDCPRLNSEPATLPNGHIMFAKAADPLKTISAASHH
nr:MAG TPA_asm: hypothetical protein [Caudoviricetes sp.]